MKSHIKSVHIFALIFGSLSALATLGMVLTLVRFIVAPEQLENRPGATLAGVIITTIVFGGAAVAGLGCFFMRKSPRGRVAGLVFGGILCLNILWVPMTLLPGYKILTIFPICLALIGVWSVLVMIHPRTRATFAGRTEDEAPAATP